MRSWLVVFLIACGGREPDPPPAKVEPRYAPLPALPPDPTNKFAEFPGVAAFGQKLFFDPAMSGPLLEDNEHGKAGERGKVSCFTCHDGPALDDPGHHISIGTGLGSRNSPPLLDASHYRWSNWAGRFDSQWSLALVVIEKPEVMNGSRVDVARLIVERYRDDYAAAFGSLPASLDPDRFPAGARPKPSQPDALDDSWERMAKEDRELVDRIYVHAGKAIAAYLRLLVGRNAPFDRFVAGQADAIGEEAKRGVKLFELHCESCHAGPHFTDNKFHALAVAQVGDGVPKIDRGRPDDLPPLQASVFNASGPWSDGRIQLTSDRPSRGEFRTPSLRNIELTPPYMHAGQFKTLANVVAFYNAGGGEVEGIRKDPLIKPLKLSDRDQADLVAFMKTLTDEPPPKALLTPPPR